VDQTSTRSRRSAIVAVSIFSYARISQATDEGEADPSSRSHLNYKVTNKYISESVSYMIQRGFNLAAAKALDSLRAERSIDNAA
jgi:hypothetical protein